jgi:hypothetical protein
MRIKDLVVRYQMGESLLLDGLIAVLKKLHIVELAQILARHFETQESLQCRSIHVHILKVKSLNVQGLHPVEHHLDLLG